MILIRERSPTLYCYQYLCRCWALP